MAADLGPLMPFEEFTPDDELGCERRIEIVSRPTSASYAGADKQPSEQIRNLDISAREKCALRYMEDAESRILQVAERSKALLNLELLLTEG